MQSQSARPGLAGRLFGGARPRAEQTPGDPADAAPPAPVNMRRLMGYVRPYVGLLVLALIALVFTTAIELSFPYLIMSLLDSVLQQRDYALLNRIALGLVALFTLRFFTAYGQHFTLAYIGERIVIDLRNQLYAHLHTLSLRFFAERRVGEIVSRLASDVTLVRSVLTVNVATLIGQTLTLIGALAIVIWMNWRMTLFILLLVPPVVGAGAIFGRRLRRRSTEVQDRLADSSTIVDEVFQNIRAVKSFVREIYEVGRYREVMRHAFDSAMGVARLRTAFMSLMYTMSFIAIAGVLWYGGREVLAGRLTAGGLASFLFYLIYIAASVGAFTGLYSQVQEALGATRRIFEILDTTPDVQDRPGAGVLESARGEIVFEDVSFSYDTRMAVLHDVSLRIEPGEVLALVGPSGAGKSTVFNLIPRFYDPSAGRILLDGHNLRDVTQASLRSQIAVVPQETLLFGGTVRENILYGKLDAAEQELIEASKAANAHQFITDLPDGYETIVGERGVKLSGGQRQRVAIARALLKDPRILLLDEATSSLDSESEFLIQEALERLLKGRTTVIIAHRLSTVQIADRVAVLEAGRLLDVGRHAELLARNGLYTRLYQMQFQVESAGR